MNINARLVQIKTEVLRLEANNKPNHANNQRVIEGIINRLLYLVEQTQEDLAAEREAIGDDDGSGNDNQER